MSSWRKTAEHRLDVNVPESGMKITSITFGGVEYLAAAVDANVGTTFTLTEDQLDWWKEAAGPALSGLDCPVVVTTKDAAGKHRDHDIEGGRLRDGCAGQVRD